MAGGPGAVCLALILPILFAGTIGHCGGGHRHRRLQIRPIAGRFVHAEGPHWDHRSQKLYFVDIEQQQICRLDPATGELTCTYLANGPVGFVIPIDDAPGQFVAGSGKDFVLVSWDGEGNVTEASTEVLATVDQNRKGNRWNDGKADSEGRFWGGTIGPEVNEQVTPDHASLYRIGKDYKPKVEVDPVTNSNGLAWNLQDDKFYYIDTPTLQIASYDYEPISGTICNKRVAFDLKKNNVTGYPDGMTIDTDGNLWIALYNGGGVINVNPRTGRLLRFIRLPVKKVTSVAFGGPLLNILYVTTSSRDLSKEELIEQPHAGYVFALEGLGVRGLIANAYEVGPGKV